MVFEDLEIEIKKLYKYCLKLSGSTWVAEDLVQETMLKVYRLKKTEPNREFNFSFLCTVAKNLFLDEKRKSKEVIHFKEDSIGGVSDSSEYYSLVELLLTTLPLKQSMLITLKDVFGYTSKEIASMLRVSNESIKTALHRSRKKLKSRNGRMDMEVIPSDHEMIIALSKAVRESEPLQIFYFYRLLESKNFQLRRSAVHSVFHVVDPDGNIIEITS
ncbi:RNA polymerase sigma factor [Halobacillus locisalis]|uniref:RNA polymerase sigma factor n=1 Tax=Halobacillus locisalis TaxID=220753 RepID=A0A838CSE9_9BACI|nr:RNA polymerase sigma factor [Halobacillus locisalis]MBA2174808.1 RNA polymerase sigma factor [Halobacillus locisalis]